MTFRERRFAEQSRGYWRSPWPVLWCSGGKLARSLRIGAFLEGLFTILRAVQSGHPGDYVLWLTVGLAVFGSASLFLLR